MNLINKGKTFSSTQCLFCENEDEDLEHYLILCPSVRTLWLKLWNWWKCGSPSSFSLADILLNHIAFPGRSQGAVKLSVELVMCFYGRFRDGVTNFFMQVDGIKNEDIFLSIHRLSLLWMSNRSGRDNMQWRDWILNNISLFQVEVKALLKLSMELVMCFYGRFRDGVTNFFMQVDGIKNEDIFPSIHRLSLLWMSNRSGRDNMQRRDWILNNM
ncbi:hypothetical protein Tco_0065968 [Tanacetum coccineum]